MADISLEVLAPEDAFDLLQFEMENRGWFEAWVGPRPNTYWHLEKLRALIHAQLEDTDLMFLIKSTETGEIQGRLNITAFNKGVGQLGYRIGQRFSGQGIARAAISHALPIARKAGLWALEARVADNNPASSRVLQCNGFSPDPNHVPVHVQGPNNTPLALTTYRRLLD